MCGRWVDVATNGLVWEKISKIAAGEGETIRARVLPETEGLRVCACVLSETERLMCFADAAVRPRA